MTIVLGFNCVDGTVLCADSLEADGVTKRNVQKIWTYQVGEEWEVAIASAGEADLVDSFNDDLRDALGNSGFDSKKASYKAQSRNRANQNVIPGRSTRDADKHFHEYSTAY